MFTTEISEVPSTSNARLRARRRRHHARCGHINAVVDALPSWASSTWTCRDAGRVGAPLSRQGR